MVEYIKREAAKKVFCEYCDWAEAGSEYCSRCPDPMAAIPSADVVPVVHGRWCYTKEITSHAVGTGNILCAPTIIPAEEGE